MKILLDYFFPVTAVEETPAASSAYLKQVLVVAKPKTGQEGNVGEIYECTSNSQIAARTDNTESAQLFSGGMSKVFLLLADDLDIAEVVNANLGEFFTILISSDFDEDDIAIVAASGIITVTSYANLVSGTDDVITIEGVAFTAQTGAATLGTATFQAATSNDLTAASLAAQINAHATTSELVVASVVGAVVTLTALENGYGGNAIDLTYTDNDTNVGATLSGLSGGKLSGGAGLDVGNFKGVVGVSSIDDDFNEDQAVIENRSAWHSTSGNKAKNMFYAFGKLLGNALGWKNQQYITMPFADDVDELGEANGFFDDKISFVLSDDEFGQRLGLFAVGGKAIACPYIKRNLVLDLQSKALQYVSANQPDYTKTEAALIEDELQKVIQLYIDRKLLSGGSIQIKIEQDNFVASGYIEVPDPKALWRIAAEMRTSS